MKHTYLLFIFFCCCTKQSTHLEYNADGQVEFEVPIKNGHWNGTAKGYYPSGKLRGVVNYVDGKMEGESFEYYESGTVVEERHYSNGVRTGTWREFDSNQHLVEEVFYDSLGYVSDFHRYKLGVRDTSYLYPIIYTRADTVRLGKKTSLFVKLGNADDQKFTKGVLLITSGLKDGMPLDTLAQIDGDNRKGFIFEFTPVTPGENQINGLLMLYTKGRYRPFRFEFTYEVK